MNFNLDKSIELLERTPNIFKALFYGLSHDWATINEGKNTWSGYTIIGHLIHGEKTDWMPRAKIILGENQDKHFEPYDRFAQDKLYANQTIEELLNEFEELRKKNLTELRSWSLTTDDLNKKGIHPELGIVTLRELISTWTIHDMAHLNQVSRVLVKHYSKDVGPWTNYIKILQES